MATCDPNTTIQPCWMCRPEKELLAAMTGLLCDISTSGGGGGGSGTVTSVGMTVPAFLSVSGSPVTTAGVLAVTLSGTALPVANGGTGITSFGAGVATFLGTPSSANLAAAVTDETGTGALVFATSPTLVTPALGTPTALVLTNATGYPAGVVTGGTQGQHYVKSSGTNYDAEWKDMAPAFATLTDGATITWTLDPELIEQTATVTLGGNRTLAFSGLVAGMRGVLIVKQDGTPPRTLALPATSKVIGAGAGAITLTNAANAIDILSWVYDGTNVFWNYGRNFT